MSATLFPRVGVLGGSGELARMGQQAAVDLDVELHVLTEDPVPPAAYAGAQIVAGSPLQAADVRRFADRVDVLTCAHEILDLEALTAAAGPVPIRPARAAMALGQDQLVTREALAALHVPVAPFIAVTGAADVSRFAADHGWPVVLKARRGGSGGRDVWFADDEADATRVVTRAQMAGVELLAEAFVDRDAEVAQLVARRPAGHVAAHPLLEVRRQDGVCREVAAPAAVSPGAARAAERIARELADALEVEGLLVVELLVAGDDVVVDRLALRPHDAAHLTIEACVTSQFEQHLRAVLDWPLGDPALVAPAAAMVAVLGPADGTDPFVRLSEALAVRGARVHRYGKPPRPGRKLGHVTALGATRDEALDIARRAAARLEGAA